MELLARSAGVALAVVLCAPAARAVPADPRGLACTERPGDERDLRWLTPDVNPPAPPVEGDFLVLVILVDFPDTPATSSPADIEQLLFGETGVSMADYFMEASGGAFRLGGVVTEWVTTSGPHADYGGNTPDGADVGATILAQEAVYLTDPVVDFSGFDRDADGIVDGLLIVHAGTGEEKGDPADVWSHSGRLEIVADGVSVQGYGMGPELQRDGQVHLTTIGVYCHEFGHQLGLPDLYDTTFASAGIGPYGLMGTGAWGQRDAHPGDGPVLPCAWSLVHLGWADVRELAEGSHRARPGEVWVTGHGCAEGESFLIRNRVQTGFDTGLPGAGILVWHVDERIADNSDAHRYRVDLEEADGRQDLELDPLAEGAEEDFFYAGNSDRFGPDTVPASDSYTEGPTGVVLHGFGARTGEIPFTFGEITPSPSADAGGPYLVGEGQVIELDATASVGAETFGWDLDGDGGYQDSNGPTPEFDATSLDGPAFRTVRLRVGGAGGLDEDDAVVEVINQDPVIVAVELDEPIVAGVPALLRIVADDPCGSDELVYDLTVDGATSAPETGDRFWLTLPTPGTFALLARVEDDDGGVATREREIYVLPPGESQGNAGCGCCGTHPGDSTGFFVLAGFLWAGIRRSARS